MPSKDEEARKAIKAAGSNTWRRNNHEHRKAYAREYYAKNPEPQQESNKRSYQKNKETRDAANREYAKNNPELVRETKQRYREREREAINAYNRDYYAKNRETLKQHPPKDPEARAAYVKQWIKDHPSARRETTRRYREANREKIREAGRLAIRDENGEIKPEHKERHRRNAAQHAIDLETMAGRPRPEVCDACGGPPDNGRGLHFDHCHTHGHFRGWICRECNLALGNVRDDRNRLRKLIAYLDRTSKSPAAQFSLPGV